MKIGFFGNMNNYPFLLAEAIRRRGHEVVFIVERTEALHRPENRYPDIPLPYPPWIEDMSPMDTWQVVLPTSSRRRVVRRLRDCDAVVLNHLGPVLAKDIGKPAIVLLTGSDLEYFANPALLQGIREERHRRPAWFAVPAKSLVYRLLLGAQRDGIARAALVNYFAPGLVARGDELLAGLGIDRSRRSHFMMTDTARIGYRPPPENAHLRVFNVARLNWKLPMEKGLSLLDYKGTDILLRGVELFRRVHPQTRLELRLVRKGMHIRETEQLVQECGLVDCVVWLEELSQGDVLREYERADIVTDQLSQGVVGMGGLDAMATGRPVIANARAEIFEELKGTASPMCHASRPDEVRVQLETLAFDADKRRQVGLASREYVVNHFSSDHAAAVCLEHLESTG